MRYENHSEEYYSRTAEDHTVKDFPVEETCCKSKFTWGRIRRLQEEGVHKETIEEAEGEGMESTFLLVCPHWRQHSVLRPRLIMASNEWSN